MSENFAIGALVQVAGVFRNPADNTLMDPSVVAFKFKSPAGVAITYVSGTDAQLVKDSTGKYHVNINADAAGWWYWKFYSTGSGQAAIKGSFKVDADDF